MIIKEYETTYLEDVINLFVEEYKVDRTEYKDNFLRFFEHPYQADQCIRIIAVDEDGRLMGFQSFFYWPYVRNGKHYKVYQSGSSIVSRHARGKGVFQKMLGYMEVVKEKYGIDFFIGFPVEASYKSFMSNGWANPFNMQWYIKVKNPFGFLFSWMYPSDNHVKWQGPFNSGVFRMENSREFLDWRQNYQKGRYRMFRYDDGAYTFEVNHKVNTRKGIFTELIIGEVLCSTNDEDFIKQAFRKYRRWLFFQWDIALISFCTNNEKDPLSQYILAYGLKPIERKVYFISKYAPETRSADWLIFRSDIDTW